jgi:hypothetical protein
VGRLSLFLEAHMGIEGVGSKQSFGIADSESQPPDAKPIEQGGSSVEAYAAKEFDSVLGPAVQDFAQKRPDPTGWLGDVNVTGDQLRYSEVGQALEDPRTTEALSKMNEGQVRNVIENEIHKAWPKLDGEQTHDLVNKFVDQVKESARYHAMEGMRKEAVSTMRELAKAKDPEQKKLLEREANRLERAGGDTVFRAMADHDVSAAFMKKAGISAESLAGKQVAAAREQGNHDRENIETMKFACSVAAAFATGGVGAGGAFGAAVMSAPGVYEKYEAIDQAKAGELAKTMKPGAADAARRNAAVAAAGAGFEVALGGLTAHKLASATGLPEAASHALVTATVLEVEHAAQKKVNR